MTKKIRVYISGPITNDKEHYEENFKKAVDFVNNQGILGFRIHEAVNPLDLEPEYTSDTKWTDKVWVDCIKKDLDLLSTCDVMVMLPGWDYSAGCITEFIAAKKLGIYIMTLHDIFGVESDDDRHNDEFPTFHARFIRDTVREIKNLKPVEQSYQIYRDKLRAVVNEALEEEKANDYGDFIIKFTNTEKYASEDTEFLKRIDTDGTVSWTDDVVYAKHMGEHEAIRSLKILRSLKADKKYEWNVEIIPIGIAKAKIKHYDKKLKTTNTTMKKTEALADESICSYEGVESNSDKIEDGYVLSFFDPKGDQKYIKSLWKESCLATDDIEDAARFTKYDAIQTMQQMLQDGTEGSMVNFTKGYKPELFIVNLAKLEK